MEKILEKILSILLTHLLGDDYELRKWSLTALSQLRGHTAGEVIFERYQCDNLEDYLALALNQADPEKASQILVSSLADPQPEIRLKAAEALTGSQSDVAARVLMDAVEAHIKTLEGGKEVSVLVSEEALISAVKALGGIGSSQCIRTLKKLAPVEPNPKVRAKAIGALGKHPEESLVAFFQGFLRDPDPRVRANAIEAIDRTGSKGMVGVLLPYLDDPHQRIRANAAKAIWKHGDFEVTQTIKDMLKSPEKPQRVSALYLIGEIKHPDFTRSLLTFLQDSDPDIRRNAVISIRKLGKPDQEKILGPLLDDIDEEIRLQSLLALTQLLGDKALPLLSERLKKDPAPTVRSAIVGELGRFANQIVLADLLESLTDQDPRVIANALESIARVLPVNPPEAIVQRLQQFLPSESNRIRANAIRILWNWGVTSSLDSLLTMLEAPEKRLKISGLHCLGEVFASVSAEKKDHLQTFETVLKRSVIQFRRIVTQKVSLASEGKIKTLFTSVNDLLRVGNNAEAMDKLKEILALSHDNVQALALLGDLHFQANQLAEAENVFRTALQIQPNLGKALYTLGVIHHRQGNWVAAREKLLAALKINPKIPNAFLLLSEALEKEGRLGDSLQALKRLFTMVPQNPQVLTRLCKLSFLAGEVKEAVQLAARVDPAKGFDPAIELILGVGDSLAQKPQTGVSRLIRLMRAWAQNPHDSRFSEIAGFLARADAVAQELRAKEAEKP